MSAKNTYFLLPLPPDGVSKSPGAPLWFVTWSEADKSFSVTSSRPAPDTVCQWALGVTKDAVPKDVVTVFADGGKDIPPPSSAALKLASPSGESTRKAFENAFRGWLNARSFTQTASKA